MIILFYVFSRDAACKCHLVADMLCLFHKGIFFFSIPYNVECCLFRKQAHGIYKPINSFLSLKSSNVEQFIAYFPLFHEFPFAWYEIGHMMHFFLVKYIEQIL